MSNDYKKSKKLAADIQNHQIDWKSLTFGLFKSQADKYKGLIRDQMYTFKLQQRKQ